MKKSALTLPFFLFVFLQNVFPQSELLDSTFSTDGKVITSFATSGLSQINAMALQPDQKILAAGWATNGNNVDFAVARYMPDGSLDAGFDLDGQRFIHFSSSTDVGRAILLQPDGKIVVAGSAFTGGNSDFALARLLENGDMDNTFGAGGLRTTAVGPGKSTITSLALQADGMIVAGGTAYSDTAPAYGRFALARYTALGALDSTFGQGGMVITSIDPISDELTALAIQPNGKIVAAGYVRHGTNNDFALAQYNPDGSLDTLFGVKGKQLTDFTGYNDRVQAMTLQPDGKIVVAGSTTAGNTLQSLALARYNANGLLDSTFGVNGKVQANLTSVPVQDGTNAVLRQPDGKIVAAGYAYFPSTGYYRFAVARFQADGTSDLNFNGNGVVTTGFLVGTEQAFAVLLQADGKIIAGGRSANPNFALARYLSGGSVGVEESPFSKEPVLVYPNPVGESATLSYTLTRPEMVTLALYDQSGRVVARIKDAELQTAGRQVQSFLLPDQLPAGLYFLVVSTPDGQSTLRLVK